MDSERLNRKGATRIRALTLSAEPIAPLDPQGQDTMIEDIQTDGIAQLCDYEQRSRMIMLTIPLCELSKNPDGTGVIDKEGYPVYFDKGDEYRDGVIEILHTMFKAMAIDNYAMGEEYGDDMTLSVEECRRENGTLRAYRHLHAVVIKPNNNPISKKVMKEITDRLHADVRTIKNPSKYTDVLNYVTKDKRYGLYQENTIHEVSKEEQELITDYERESMPKWAKLLNDLPSDRRTIHVVLDKKGGSGKSFFSKYLWARKKAFYICDCQNSASIERTIVDICTELDRKKEPRPRILIADLPRAKDIGEPIYWEAMERARNGILTEDRYHTKQLLVNIDKAILFCNNLPWDGRYDKTTESWRIWPTLGTLESHDRFIVWEIENNELKGPYLYYKQNPNETEKYAEYEVLTAEVEEEGDMVEHQYKTKRGAGLYMKVETKLKAH